MLLCQELPKKVYIITEHGKKLIPIFEQLHAWGEEIGVILACDEKHS
jgi:DNA-binding HxlR family transcriptional regulator